jgi:hypothetical protein
MLEERPQINVSVCHEASVAFHRPHLNNKPTNSLYRILVWKLVVAQLLKNFSVFYELGPSHPVSWWPPLATKLVILVNAGTSYRLEQF